MKKLELKKLELKMLELKMLELKMHKDKLVLLLYLLENRCHLVKLEINNRNLIILIMKEF
jgi:hypothetical protein